MLCNVFELNRATVVSVAGCVDPIRLLINLLMEPMSAHVHPVQSGNLSYVEP